jgi:hypothetical protein
MTSHINDPVIRRTFPVLFVGTNVKSGRVHELHFEHRVSARRYHKSMSEFYCNVRITRSR